MNIGPVPRCLCECGLYIDISYAAVPISCEAIDIVKVRVRIRVKSMNVYKDSSLIASLQRMEKNRSKSSAAEKEKERCAFSRDKSLFFCLKREKEVMMVMMNGPCA